ncbi:Ribosome biogenesis protein nsa2 [Colletotrichum sp. SAR 10_86]|nr:Ribosome biogenesis protein nsa2 [Colletotrichum sp. SAR 10_76]KAI8237087.1 Ribosome biogenesis protein nsa2 [Colletotrichum sp. SAR 10_86]
MLDDYLRHRLDTEERERKCRARAGHKQSHNVQGLRGSRAKMMQEKRRVEKIQIPSPPTRSHTISGPKRSKRRQSPGVVYRSEAQREAARFQDPLPKVRGISEEEMFKVVTTGKKTHQKSWKRMVNNPIFVGKGFTRQNPEAEMFIRPMGLRQKFAHVSHPTLGVTMKAPILSAKNPQDPMYTHLGVLTRGTVAEVNVSDLGLTTTTGMSVWGRSDSNMLSILLV